MSSVAYRGSKPGWLDSWAVYDPRASKDDCMTDEPTVAELFERAESVRQQAAELWAEHERIHDELVSIFERIKKLHDLPPVLGNEPPGPPPPPRAGCKR